MQIENCKMVFLRLQRKTIHAQSYAYLRICVFSKEITALTNWLIVMEQNGVCGLVATKSMCGRNLCEARGVALVRGCS